MPIIKINFHGRRLHAIGEYQKFCREIDVKDDRALFLKSLVGDKAKLLYEQPEILALYTEYECLHRIILEF